MTNLDSESNKLEWVKQVRQFLLDLARACLADIPRLPLDLSQRAMPLMKEAQSIQDGDRTHWQAHELDWLEQVRQFLVELTRASLAERPKLPENTSQRAIALADKAQSLQATVAAPPTAFKDPEPTLDAPLTQRFPPQGQEPTQVSPLALMEQLHASLEGDRRLSHTPNAPEWQHMLTLVEVAKAIYQRLQE